MSEEGNEQPLSAEETAAKLNNETAVIAWDELVRHFARGVVIKIEPSLDLIEAATCLSEDNTDQFQQWVEQGKLGRASDDDARDWAKREPEFWCCVAAPWVLVQEKLPGSSKIN